MQKVAINGFGRIGRLVFRQLLDKYFSDIEVAAVNDLGDLKTMIHLLRHDSLYGKFGRKVEIKSEDLFSAEGRDVKMLQEKNPLNLPWKEMGIDVVLECTGAFRDIEGAQKHIDSGAKKVIISAPAKSEEIPTYLLGVNHGDFNPETDKIVSMGSCTTNCLAPVVKVLDEVFGIEKGFMTTVHSYTNDQRILDLPHKDLRRARAAGVNIIPTTTGAAKTVEKCLPSLKGKLDGIALRVPTPTVSIVDFTAVLKKEASAEEVNRALEQASKSPDLKGILAMEKEPLVSSDYRANEHSSVVDVSLTQAFGNLAKVFSWYDNEWGYATRLADFAHFVGRKSPKA